MAESYGKSLSVEQEGLKILAPILRECCCEGFIQFDRGPMNKTLQKYGDGIMRSKFSKDVVTIELKFESEDRHGNFFFERWSNRARFTPGWFESSLADVLIYQFNSDRSCYLARMFELRKWAYGLRSNDEENIRRYPLKPEKQCNQLNDTWGYCVPINHVCRDVRCKRIDLAQDAQAVYQQLLLGLSDPSFQEVAANS